MRIIKAGATSQSVYVEILDSTSTSGARKTGLAYNTASLTAYYARNGASAVAITLATLAAANSAYSSGGFKELDATNMPGVYRLDVPDAALAAGVPSVVITLKGATGMVQCSVEIQLSAVDMQDAVRGGMTALPNANAEAAGGLFTRGTGAGQINQAANGQVDTNTVYWKGSTAPAMTGDAYARIGAAGAGLTGIPWNASWDAEVQSEVDDALDTVISDSVAADGSRPTIRQALLMLTRYMFERSVSSTTVTVKKEDGSTSSMTFTLNDASAPTSITRAS